MHHGEMISGRAAAGMVALYELSLALLVFFSRCSTQVIDAWQGRRTGTHLLREPTIMNIRDRLDRCRPDTTASLSSNEALTGRTLGARTPHSKQPSEERLNP